MSRTTLSRVLDGHLIISSPAAPHSVSTQPSPHPNHVARMLLLVYQRSRVEHAIFVGQVRAGIWTKRTRFVTDTKSLQNRRATAPVRPSIAMRSTQMVRTGPEELQRDDVICRLSPLRAPARRHPPRRRGNIIRALHISDGHPSRGSRTPGSDAALGSPFCRRKIRSLQQGLLAFDAMHIPRPAEFVSPVEQQGFTLLPLPIASPDQDPLQPVVQLHKQAATAAYARLRQLRRMPDNDWEAMMASRMAMLSEAVRAGLAGLPADGVQALLRTSLLLDG